MGLRILDERGQPINPRIESALVSLVPRLQRQVPAFRDDGALIEALEEAGRRITHREVEAGAIERLHAYAWVTLRSIATSRMRTGGGRLAQRTVASADGETLLDTAPAKYGTVEEIERAILVREILDTLTPEERLICIWKKAGFSSQEIAARRGGSAAAVDTLLSRIKQRVRALISLPPAARRHERRPAGPRRSGGIDIEHPDGK
jgi:RNA polymerase sigma factor (sigma-70 family)